MKYLFVLVVHLLFSSAFCQNYTVTYERQYWDYNYKTLIKRSQDELSVKDSVAYFYTLFNGKKSKLPLGSQFLSHALYLDLRHNTKLRQSYPYSRKRFLVVDTITRQDWSLYDDTKTIQGYLCQRATCIQNGQLVIVWFAPTLPSSFGPDGFVGLPGLILEINYAGTTNRIIAQKVALTVKPMVVPTDGKPITPMEFNKYLDRNRPPSFRLTIRR